MPLNNRIYIRVYKRIPRGTILIWNTNLLTEEQRKNYKVQTLRMTDSKWLQPITEPPDVSRMAAVLDNNTDAIMILHDDKIEEDTPFIAKITFGNDEKETSVKVAGRNSHMPYLKPIRTKSGIYALPVVIVDDFRSGVPLTEQPLRKEQTEEDG